MSETIGVNVLKRAYNMDVSPQFDGYSGVRIFIGTDENGDAVTYFAGNENGRVLEIKNPFGTQQMANNILAGIQGYQYQPLSADAALLNPAAEMGDGVTVNGVYSGIFVRATQFGRLMASDIEAPTDEEIEHEFAIETPSDRQYTRFVRQTKSMITQTNLAIEAEVDRVDRDVFDANNPTSIVSRLRIQADEISARVTKTGRNGSNTFAWSLDADGFFINDGAITASMKQNRSAKFNFTSSGLKINGEISATKGTIGGFTIGSTSLYTNGMSSMSSGQTNGVHVGTDGIKLGQKFSVGTDGILTATGIKLKGSIDFYDSNGRYINSLSANNFYTGAKNGYDWEHSYYGNTGYTYADYAILGAGEGYSWANDYYGDTGMTYAGYAMGGAGGGYNYNLATDPTSGVYPNYFTVGALKLTNPSFELYGGTVSWQSMTVKNGLDQTVTIYYLGRQ